MRLTCGSVRRRSDAARRSKVSAQRLEGGPELLDEELRLLPSREVPAFVEPVVVNQLWERFFCPTPRSCIDLIRKDAHGNRDGDAFRGEEGELVFPIQTSRRDCRVRQPVECDIVEDVVSRQTLGLTVEDTCDELVTARVVV